VVQQQEQIRQQQLLQQQQMQQQQQLRMQQMQQLRMQQMQMQASQPAAPASMAAGGTGSSEHTAPDAPPTGGGSGLGEIEKDQGGWQPYEVRDLESGEAYWYKEEQLVWAAPLSAQLVSAAPRSALVLSDPLSVRFRPR